MKLQAFELYPFRSMPPRDHEAAARAERDAAIERLWLAGASQVALASRFGVTNTRVGQVLRDRGAQEIRTRRVAIADSTNSNAAAGHRGAAKTTRPGRRESD